MNKFFLQRQAAMLRLTTQAAAEALENERFQHPYPHVRRKMEALWLKSQGLAHQDIARFAGVSGKTLCTCLQQYVEGGVAGLKELHFRRPQSELVAHQETIAASLLAHPPASINEAVDAIRTLTGLSRSPTQVRLFLKEKCGMKRLKPVSAAARAWPAVASRMRRCSRERLVFIVMVSGGQLRAKASKGAMSRASAACRAAI
ncbi:MAG: helix-turn-helix domain-containing protein [Candidatus Accumulibacter necessarius]|uniref:helix-turn-helix domain-containing protein n=1 Tax=Candidatus Accumulibacter necessarius TaxID=2954386 RepID=UPI002FC3B598